ARDVMLRNIEALIGVLSSSAPAVAAVSPSITRPVTTTIASRMTLHLTMAMIPHRPSVIDQQRVQRVVLELLSAVEKRQLDHERHADDAATEQLDQPQRRRHR